MTSEAPVVDISVDDRCVTISLNRPDKRNSLTLEMDAAIHAALTAHEDVELPVVLRSSTPGMFISGTDVESLRRRSTSQSLARTTSTLCQHIANHPRPTIAVVEGYALGGGCEVALACDFRISESSAKWGFPEVRLGIIPGAGGLNRLPELVGLGNATDLVLTGRRIDAEEAKSIGMVQRVADSDQLDEVLDEVLADLRQGSPLAQRLAKEAMHVGADPRRLVDAATQALCIANEDTQRRLAALTDKAGNRT